MFRKKKIEVEIEKTIFEDEFYLENNFYLIILNTPQTKFLIFAKADGTSINLELITEVRRFPSLYLFPIGAIPRIFDYIIGKIQKRLSGWKAKTLSIAGRSTFINFVVMLYQSRGARKYIRITNKNFLWGNKDEKQRTHLVN